MAGEKLRLLVIMAHPHDEEYVRRRVEVQLGQQGMWALVPYAEGFVQERPQTVSRIEVSEHSLQRATQLRVDAVRAVAGKK